MPNTAFTTTCRLQPIVIIFSCVSVCSKLASRQLPANALSTVDFIRQCFCNWKLIALVTAMILLLGVYAFVWQIVIKQAKIAIVYANKSSYLFWTQLAAVFIFGERVSICNVLGIVLIFSGVILGNSETAK